MKTGRVFYVGTHKYSSNKPEEVIGVVFITPQGEESRPCFRLRRENGTEEFVPISETQHYELISEDDVKEGRIPPRAKEEKLR